MNKNQYSHYSDPSNSFHRTQLRIERYPYTTFLLCRGNDGLWLRSCRSNFNSLRESLWTPPLFHLDRHFKMETVMITRSSIIGLQRHPRIHFSSSSDVFENELSPPASSTMVDGDILDDVEASANDEDVLQSTDFLDVDYETDPLLPSESSIGPVCDSDFNGAKGDPLNSAMYNENISVYPTAGYVPRRGSMVEQRVSAQQLSQMEQVTQHLISQKTFKTVEVSEEEIRAAFLYWISRPVRDMYFYREGNPDIPLQGSAQILHWLMHQLDDVAETEQEKHLVASTIEYVLCTSTNQDESSNAGMCRLMSLFSQTLQGTNAAMKEYGRRIDDNASRRLACLLAASRVCDVMQRIHNDNKYFPNVQPDGQSYQTLLNLYGRRCKFLVFMGPPPKMEGSHFPRIRRGVRWSSPETIQALGGCGSTRECISAAKALIDQMKKDPKSPNPSMIHYSVLLSMMSCSSGLNIGMADEAYTLLQDLIADPGIKKSISLYNPVLLAYVLEAAECKKRGRWEQQRLVQKKCEVLWDHMLAHNDPTIAADPVTYSIIIKLYRTLDHAEIAQNILETMEAAAVTRSSLPSFLPESAPQSMRTGTVDDNRLPPNPSLMHYNTVLNAWSKSSNPQSGDRALALVRRMEDQIVAKTGLPHPVVPRPDHVSLTSALDALLRGPNVEGVIAHMEQILQKFEACDEVERRPDSVTYNVIFQTLFRRVLEQTDPLLKIQIANEMEQLFQRLKKDSSNFRATAGNRLFRYYNDCIRVWANTDSPESANRAMHLFRDMDEASSSGEFPSARPNGTTYQFLLSSLSRFDDAEYIKACRELFVRMEETNVPVTVTALMLYLGRLLRCRFGAAVDENDAIFVEILMERIRAKITRDDGFTVGWVIEGIFSHITKETDCHQKAAWAYRVERFFRAVLREPHFFRFSDGQKLTFYYNNCIKVWAFARSPDSTANALRLLFEMEENCRGTRYDPSDPMCCRPDVKTYEYVLTCLTRSPDAISVKTARDIFRKMEIDNVPITLSVLNRFIRILSNSGVEGSLLEAERILKAVEDDYLAGNIGSFCPNSLSYTFLIEGHMKAYGGLRHAERLLDHMNDLSKKTGKTDLLPSPKLYIDLINRWSESVAFDSIDRVDGLFHKMAELAKPSSYDYATLQAAWGRSKRPDAPQQVESILVFMQQEYEKGNNPYVRPSIENFDLVIKTWATSKQDGSTERADAVLKLLEDLCYANKGPYSDMRPSTSCYQHAILGWTLSDHPDAGERALALLKRMTYYRDAARGAPSVNQACYHHVMSAIGKSATPHKADKCYELLKEMRTAYETRRNRYSWPTHETFKSVLGVCACCTQSTEEKNEALDVCVKTMKDYVKLAHLDIKKDVYVQFLYAVFRLLPAGDERDQVVLYIMADEQYKCPAPIFDSWSVREGLAKTVSQKAFAQIARSCGRNPLLKTLMSNRDRE
jgi:hypothetical protein